MFHYELTSIYDVVLTVKQFDNEKGPVSPTLT